MPVIIACQSCGRKLRVVEAQLGRKVRCPGCKNVFVAEADDGVPEDAISNKPSSRSSTSSIGDRLPVVSGKSGSESDDEEELETEDDDGGNRFRIRSLSPKALKTEGMKKIKLGIILYLFYLLASFVGPIIEGLMKAVVGLGFASRGFTTGGWTAGLVVSAVISVLFALIIWGLYGTSSALYAFSPDVPDTGLRPLGIATCALGVSAAGLIVLGTIIDLATIGMMAASAFASGAALWSVGGVAKVFAFLIIYGNSYVFPFFLRSVSIVVKRRDLAGNFVKWVIWYVIMQAASLLIVALMCGIAALVGASLMNAVVGGSSNNIASITNGGTILMAAGCATIILIGAAILGISIWFIVLIFQILGALSSWLKRRR